MSGQQAKMVGAGSCFSTAIPTRPAARGKNCRSCRFSSGDQSSRHPRHWRRAPPPGHGQLLEQWLVRSSVRRIRSMWRCRSSIIQNIRAGHPSTRAFPSRRDRFLHASPSARAGKRCRGRRLPMRLACPHCGKGGHPHRALRGPSPCRRRHHRRHRCSLSPSIGRLRSSRGPFAKLGKTSCP